MDFACLLFRMKMVTFDSKFLSKWNLPLFSFVDWQTDRNRKEKEVKFVPLGHGSQILRRLSKGRNERSFNFEDKKDAAAALHSIEMWLDFRPTFSSRVSLLFKPFLSVTLDHLHKTAKNKNMIFNFPQSFYPWFRKRSLNEDCKRIVNKTKQINHCTKKEVFIAKVCQAYLSIAQQFFQFKSFAFAGYHPL